MRHFPARRSINGRAEVAGPARTIRSASRRIPSAFAPATSMTRSAAALRGPVAGRRPGAHRPVLRLGVGTDGARDRPADQPEAEERDLHVSEYRSRRGGRCAEGTVSRASRPSRCLRPVAGSTRRRRRAGARSDDPQRDAPGSRALGPSPSSCLRPRLVPVHRSGAGGGPGSFAGFSRRMVIRRSGPRRSSCIAVPQRGQRRSSAAIDDSGETV